MILSDKNQKKKGNYSLRVDPWRLEDGQLILKITDPGFQTVSLLKNVLQLLQSEPWSIRVIFGENEFPFQIHLMFIYQKWDT